MPVMRRASSATPASDWLMTAVGPPPCATRIFPDDIHVSFIRCSGYPLSAASTARRRGPPTRRPADSVLQFGATVRRHARRSVAARGRRLRPDILGEEFFDAGPEIGPVRHQLPAVAF